jgi:hypothetical protein
VVTKISKDAGFAKGLRRVSADSTHTQEGNRTAAIGTIHFFSGDFQDGFEEADARFADGELRSVNADGQSADARGDVVASEGTLAAFV